MCLWEGVGEGVVGWVGGHKSGFYVNYFYPK